jgi:putative DNA methylase
MNVLGRLLMELREELRIAPQEQWDELQPLDVPDFCLLGHQIVAVENKFRRHPVPHTVTPPRQTAESPAAMVFSETQKVNAARKKLIEVSIPLEAINVASLREKQIKTGKPLQIHHYWARRPLTTCRAVLFSQFVDDPSSWPERFDHDDEKIAAERRRLHKLIERMVPWEASNDETILNEARWEIARSVAWGLGEAPPAQGDRAAILDYLQTKAPPVYDPFSGGGSIPLEAQRLGLRVYGSDLNPVAVMIGKALVEIPPKFAGRPPVNPKARAEATHGQVRPWKGSQGLAEDVRYYGQWMRDEAEKRIGHLYPKVTLLDGSQATVISWLWARTVRSPDPAAKGAMVPLVSSFVLSTREGKKAWVEPVIDPAASDGYRFEVKAGALSKADQERLKLGTKAGKGQAFVCILTGSAIDRGYIQAEGKADRLSQRLMTIVAQGARNRVYLAPNAEHEAVPNSARAYPVVDEARATFLSLPTPTRAMITGGVCSAYGLRTHGHLFTPRQLVALTTFSDLVAEAREKALADALRAGLPDDDAPLYSGGTGSVSYADAIATYLALALDRVADWNNTISRWENTVEVPQQLFARQAMPMSWDYAEANPIGAATGSLTATLENIRRAFDSLSFVPGGKAGVSMIDAAKNSFPARPVVISTDPPYFDNIGYADLSDFFYVWFRRSLVEIWPELFRRLTTPKAEELVATPYRFPDGELPDWVMRMPSLTQQWPKMGGKDRAEAFFMHGMGEALMAMSMAATDNEPLAIYYAFKQSELAEEGITSAGWASFLQAVINAGLTVDGTWPVRTELANRMIAKDANALASSIVLVCRKRATHAATITRAEFIRALKHELPEAIDDIRKAGVGPVDMQQSVVGPGMGVFTRLAKVLEDDDSTMTVKTALALINRVWEEIETELDANFDAETQVALAWFATYGFDIRTSGELITLANAKNVPLGALFAAGVFKDLHGQACLMPRAELPAGWDPATDNTATVWECVQHTARALAAEDGGAEAAASLVARMGPKSREARLLAERLFLLSTQKGWASEALVYNQLAQEWAHLEDIATGVDPLARLGEPAQGSLALAGGRT